MKPHKRQRLAKASILASLCFFLFSFSIPSGGDVIEIYLNKKMVLQQFVLRDAPIKSITLGASDMKQQLEVYYKHCGLAGKTRSITLKDGQQKTIKTWRFTDAAGKNMSMVINVKDFFEGIRKQDDKMHLYYSSKEIPAGRLLTDIVLQQQTVANR